MSNKRLPLFRYTAQRESCLSTIALTNIPNMVMMRGEDTKNLPMY